MESSNSNLEKLLVPHYLLLSTYYSLFMFHCFVFESITIVTGPSFRSETFMSAPKIPLSVFNPDFEISVLKYSKSGIVFFGFCSFNKRWSISFFVIRNQSELTDAKNSTRNIHYRTI